VVLPAATAAVLQQPLTGVQQLQQHHQQHLQQPHQAQQQQQLLAPHMGVGRHAPFGGLQLGRQESVDFLECVEDLMSPGWEHRLMSGAH
jgi:hypothetical protein